MTGTTVVFQIVFGSLAAAGGAVAACWFCRARIREMKRWKDEIVRAQAILAQAEGVTTSVADDVGQHTTRVSAINAELASLKTTGSARITAAVTELINVNQKIQQRLAEAEEKLQEQSHALATQVIEARTDALTGLPNRRAFDDELARRFSEFQRHGTAFSAMLLDIDHFKQFNDRYGHATGDEVLRGISQELQRTIRGLDMVARYGGEEFVVVLPRASVEEARQAGERYRLAIETARFHCSGEDLAVTTSVGVAQILANENPLEMLRRADRALYASKRAGRNRLHWHDGRDVHPFPAADLPKPSSQPADAATSVCHAPTGTPNNGPVSQPASATDVDRPVPVLVTNEPDDHSEAEGEGAGTTFTDQHDRLSFVRNVRHRVGEWKRTAATFTVMLVRVDEYARIAADHGQSMAHMVVLATLKFLSGSLRDMDVIGRYSDDSFALLLPHTTLPTAAVVARRVHEGVARCVLPAKRDTLHVTVSIGITEPVVGDDAVILLRRCEAALLNADTGSDYFHNGRVPAPLPNALVAYPPPVVQ